MAITPRPFGATTAPLQAETSTPLRRCTFRRVSAAKGHARDLPIYEVACMFPDRSRPIALGDIESARPICERCTAKGIFRADSD